MLQRRRLDAHHYWRGTFIHHRMIRHDDTASPARVIVRADKDTTRVIPVLLPESRFRVASHREERAEQYMTREHIRRIQQRPPDMLGVLLCCDRMMI